MGPTLGARASIDLTVTEADTAQSLGSGDVAVLGTPRVLALAEAATIAALVPSLAPELTTVGVRAEIDHLAPTVVGRFVTATAELIDVEERRLTFAIEVYEGPTIIARGCVSRMIVDRDRFLAKAQAQAQAQ